MRHPWSRFTAAGAATLLVALLPSVADSVPRGPEVGSITGTVQNVDFPAGDTHVAADRVGDVIRVKKYDVNGNGSGEPVGYYDMDDLQPGKYRVRFFDTGGTRAWQWHPGTRDITKATVFEVKAGQTVSRVNTTLEPAGNILATITSPPGTDLSRSNAFVSAYHLQGNVWKPVPSEAAKHWLDHGLTARLGGLPTGTYRFHYDTNLGSQGTASGFLGGTDDPATSTPVRVVAGQSTAIEFTPRRGGVLTGRVVDPEGLPVSGVRIYPSRLEHRPDPEWHGRTDGETDADGRYTIAGLTTGDYAVRIAPPGPWQGAWSGGAIKDYTVRYPSSSTPPYDTTLVRVEAERTTTWRDEVLKPAGTLEGTIRDNRGAPVAGVEVVARTGYGWIFGDVTNFDGPVHRTVSDAEGHWTFGQLGHNPYKLLFTDPTEAYYDPYYETLEYSGGDSTRSFAGKIVLPGRRNVADVETTPRYPAVSDTSPVVGQALSSTLTIGETALSTDPEAVWTWKRDGRVIPGADAPTYLSTTGDRGARLTATVTSGRSGRTVTHVSKATLGVATSRPTLTLSAASPTEGRVVLTVKASSAGVAASLLDGPISIGRVRRGSDHLVTRTMRNGSLVATLTGQPKGKKTFSVTFKAVTDRYSASRTVTRTITVK